MASVKGFVEKIKYRNEDNGYTVLSVTGSEDGEEYILVGSFSYISEGELIEASGHITEHPVYGEQLAVEHYEIRPPEDTVSMERYLGSGAIKGIGAALASRIVKKFKTDTFRIMEEEPERLAEVKEELLTVLHPALKWHWPLYLALIEADAAVSEELNYPSPEALRARAEELKAML